MTGPNPSPSPVEALLRHVANRGHDAARAEAATATLVEMALPTVAKVVARTAGGRLSQDDLLGEGYVGLLVAIEEYSARGGDGTGFLPYVERVLGLYIDAALAQDAELVAADEQLAADVNLLQETVFGLRRTLSRDATEKEIIEKLGWTEEYRLMIAGLLARAQVAADEELLPFLDDEASVEPDQ